MESEDLDLQKSPKREGLSTACNSLGPFRASHGCPLPQGKAGTTGVLKKEIGTWRLNGLSRAGAALLTAPRAPSQLGQALLPSRGTWAPASTWARAASGFLISGAKASWNRFAGKGLDYSRNLWVGRRGQLLIPCCPSGPTLVYQAPGTGHLPPSVSGLEPALSCQPRSCGCRQTSEPGCAGLFTGA